MIDEVQRLIDSYNQWLKDKTTLKRLNETWVEITTPYIDRHNDCLQLYAKREDRGFLLTDDGYIISDLAHSGCKLDSPKRQDLLKMTLAGFGVTNSSGALEVTASAENFAQRKHSLIQAMLAVNDLFYTSVPMVASLFYEDVVAWFETADIRFTPNVKFTGKSGYDHMFDFVIPKSRKEPERIIQAITKPGRDTAEAVAFKWMDTREVRSAESRAFALLNDQEHRVSGNVIDALHNYDVETILFSKRDEFRQVLGN